MEIDWKLVAFEILNFGVLVFLLTRFLFDPIRSVLEKRRKQAEERHEEIRQREHAADALRESYQAKLDAAGEEADGIRREARAAAESRAEEIVAEARAEMDEARRRAETEIEAARARALLDLRSEVLELAVDAASRVATDAAGTDVAAAYARRAAEELLRRSGRPTEGARLRVLVSPDADAAAIERMLAEVIGDGCDFETSVDQELRGGVRLVLRDLEVDASAGASLEGWIADTAESGGDAAPPDEPVAAGLATGEEVS